MKSINSQLQTVSFESTTNTINMDMRKSHGKAHVTVHKCSCCHTHQLFLCLRMASVEFELSPLFTMTNESSALEVLQEMTQQMAALQNNVDEIQQQHPPVQNGGMQEGDEEEEITGNLMELSKSTATFLELAFLVTIKNADCKMQLEQIGVPLIHAIRCPKLNPVV